MKPKHEPKLKRQAVEYLQKNRGKFKKIASDTGLSRGFIAKLARDGVGDPGVTRVEILLIYGGLMQGDATDNDS